MSPSGLHSLFEGLAWAAALVVGWWMRRHEFAAVPLPMAGRRYPLVGTVSMDNITVDLGPDAGAGRLRGERAILIGRQGEERITAEEVARRLGTINYEVTCALTPRVSRAYHRDGVPLGAAAAEPSA